MGRLTKNDLIKTLRAANVDVPVKATAKQLKVLYHQLPQMIRSMNPCDSLEEEEQTDVNTTTELHQCSLTNLPSSSPLPVDVPDTENVQGTSPATPVVSSMPNCSPDVRPMPSCSFDAQQLPNFLSAVRPMPSCSLAAELMPISVSAAELQPNRLPAAQFTQTSDPPVAPVNTADAAQNTVLNEEMLDNQLVQLRKKRELLLLQSEIDALTKNLQTLKPLQHKITDVSLIESMVTKFTADDFYDVQKWFQDLEDAFVILEFDERMPFVACRRMLEGTAKVFVRTISVFQYADLKHALIGEFGKMRTTQEVYAQLQSRRLKPGEIAMKSSVPESELVDLIIDGIGDSSVHSSMLYAATSVEMLKSIVERYERRRFRPLATEKHVAVVSRKSVVATKTAVNNPSHNSEFTRSPSTTSATSVSAAESTRCFNCSEFGHYQSQCPMPKRPLNSCFKCASLDHIYQNCPYRASAVTAAPAAIPSRNTFRTVAAVEGNEDELDAIDSLKMVSVAFNNRVDHGKFIELFCLLDSGSPRSFVRHAEVPCAFENLKSDLNYRSIGNYLLKPLGIIQCTILLSNYDVIEPELIARL